MKWTVRGVSPEAVERAREMAVDMGSLGAVVDEAVRRLYEAGDWPRKALPVESISDPAEFGRLFETHSFLLKSVIEQLTEHMPWDRIPPEVRQFIEG